MEVEVFNRAMPMPETTEGATDMLEMPRNFRKYVQIEEKCHKPNSISPS